jgi:hypothetical protein
MRDPISTLQHIRMILDKAQDGGLIDGLLFIFGTYAAMAS